MLLGLLSDTHGRCERMQQAVRALRARGASALVHCGDIGTEKVLNELQGCTAWFVWGNNDDPHGPLADYARDLGLALPPSPPLRLELAGKRIAVLHGDEREFANLWRAADSPAGIELDYVFYGHTHVPDDRRRGATRFVNPGALHRARSFTVATLDLTADELHFWELLEDGATRPFSLLQAR